MNEYGKKHESTAWRIFKHWKLFITIIILVILSPLIYAVAIGVEGFIMGIIGLVDGISGIFDGISDIGDSIFGTGKEEVDDDGNVDDGDDSSSSSSCSTATIAILGITSELFC